MIARNTNPSENVWKHFNQNLHKHNYNSASVSITATITTKGGGENPTTKKGKEPQ